MLLVLENVLGNNPRNSKELCLISVFQEGIPGGRAWSVIMANIFSRKLEKKPKPKKKKQPKTHKTPQTITQKNSKNRGVRNEI